MDRSARYPATYSEVLQRGLQPRRARGETLANRARLNPSAKPPGRVSLAAPSRPVRTERFKPKEAEWHVRGKEAAHAFVAAVLADDPEKMDEAFYCRDGSIKRLYEIIIEKWDPKSNRPAWQSVFLLEWFREAVKGPSIDQLREIEENIYHFAGPRGLLLQEVRTTLLFSVNERLLADEFLNAVRESGDLGHASERFRSLFEKAGLGLPQTRQRMRELLAEILLPLSDDQRDWVMEASPTLAVMVLRQLLGMVDPQELETSSNC
jgi:hypothetical protein